MTHHRKIRSTTDEFDADTLNLGDLRTWLAEHSNRPDEQSVHAEVRVRTLVLRVQTVVEDPPPETEETYDRGGSPGFEQGVRSAVRRGQ